MQEVKDPARLSRIEDELMDRIMKGGGIRWLTFKDKGPGEAYIHRRSVHDTLGIEMGSLTPKGYDRAVLLIDSVPMLKFMVEVGNKIFKGTAKEVKGRLRRLLEREIS